MGLDAQDLVNMLTQQRNAALNTAAELGALLAQANRKIIELEKKAEPSEREQNKPDLG